MESTAIVNMSSIPKQQFENQCGICLKTFPNSKSLHRHTQTHTDTKYTCEKCNKVFTRFDNLHRHMQSHETKQFSCEQCHKIFSRKDNLISHKKRHGTEFNCDYCGKVFYRQDALNEHSCVQQGGGRKRSLETTGLPQKRVKLDPKENYKITTEHEAYNEKFQASQTLYRISVHELEVKDLSNILEAFHQLFTSILKDITELHKEDDFVSVKLDTPQLDFPINIGMRRCRFLTVQSILEEIETVLQSNEDFILDEDFKIEILHIKSPKGGTKKSGYVNLQRMLDSKRSIIQIKNKDEMCCARAIITAKALLDKDEKWEDIRRGRKIQEKLARELHEKASVPLVSCGIEEVKKFQFALPGYQIHVVSKDHLNAIIYEGPRSEKKIYLYFHDDHYDVITTMSGFLSRSYFCTSCNRAYNTKENHKCNNVCHRCRHIHKEEENEMLEHCEKCNRYFQGKSCLDLHNKVTKQGKSTCRIIYRCQCGKLINNDHHKRKNKHQCGEMFCSVCDDYFSPGHMCYMKPLQEGDDNEEVSETKKNKTKKGFYIFFDFEATQDFRNECLKGYNPLNGKCQNCNKSSCGAFQHLPNACVAQRVCLKCLNHPVTVESVCDSCGKNQHYFSGDKTTKEFCQWLFSDENNGATVIAHNFKGYDSFPILQYLYDNGIKPTVIPNGSKNMFIAVPACNIRMIDSLNFLPTSLAKLPAMFGLKELSKGYFPHFFNRSENQNVVQKGLPDMNYYNPDALKVEDRIQFMEWYEEHKDDHFDFKKEIFKYCVSDVDILRQCCLKFRDMFMKVSAKSEVDKGVDPFKKCITIASACNLLYRRNFLKDNQIGIIPAQGYRPEVKYSFKALTWLKYMAHVTRKYIQHAQNGGEKNEGRYKIDGYYEEEDGTRVALEFHGCFWHGCPKCFSRSTVNPVNNKTMDELYQGTLDKEKFLKDCNYSYKCIWECDFDRQVQMNTEMRDFIESINIIAPLEPRDAFYGGRTEAFNLQKIASESEAIRYYDVISLYPYVNKTRKYPIGHPEIVTENFKSIDEYEGLVKCKILPPRGKYLPVLPLKINNKLLFTLCRTCAETKQHISCSHTDDERSLIGTWVTDEIKKAIEIGYNLQELYEVWHFDNVQQYDPETQQGGLFTKYINTFLKIKQEASGWPDWCHTDAKKNEYIKDFHEREGILLDYQNIKKNPGLRTLAKLMLNSFWGKFGQRSNLNQVLYMDDPVDLHDILSSDEQEVTGINFINDGMVEVRWKYRKDFEGTSSKTNVVIAAYTTSHARLKLYSYLEKLGTRAIYSDTDSIVFSVKENEYEPPLGDYLGDLSDETDKDINIVHFVTGGPKNYAYRLSNGKEVCKVRGITLNFNNTKLVNFHSLDNMIKGVGDDIIKVTDHFNIVRKDKKILTTIQNKDYRIVFDKRVIKDNYSTVPYGF